jgi:hypothetical protein
VKVSSKRREPEGERGRLHRVAPRVATQLAREAEPRHESQREKRDGEEHRERHREAADHIGAEPDISRLPDE